MVVRLQEELPAHAVAAGAHTQGEADLQEPKAEEQPGEESVAAASEDLAARGLLGGSPGRLGPLGSSFRAHAGLLGAS